MTYEFTSSEDKIINGVGIRGLAIGVILILIAVVDLVKMYTNHVDIGISNGITMFQDFFLVIIAVAFLLPFSNFRAIAHTEGKDIPELMGGFSRMKIGFGLIAIVMALTIFSELARFVWEG